MIVIVLALFVFALIAVFWVDILLMFRLLLLLFLLFWLLLMLATTLATTLKTDMTVQRKTIWLMPTTLLSASEGQPLLAPPPRGR